VRERRSGTGRLRSGQRDLGPARYEIHVGVRNRPETVVELESPPVAQDGEILELIREDGQVLQMQVRGVSSYCRVIGGRLTREQRANKRTTVSSDKYQARRRSDARARLTVHHPARAESAERRGGDRLQRPTCVYCGTDAYVRSIRRTADEVYFSCDGCEAMWALSRPRSNGHHRPPESR
jgi:hypothetical protein